MMILRYAPASPYARKVRMAADMLGLSDRITLATADTMDPNDDLRRQNPLGKIPTLMLENGEALYDSRVIIAYLDALAGGGRLIPAGWSRFEALRLEALADGIMDACILQVYEARWRPDDRREERWLRHQAEKVERGLDAAEALPLSGERDHVGHVALACALGYLDLRFEARWRAGRPRLVSWLDDFAQRVPAVENTRFKG